MSLPYPSEKGNNPWTPSDPSQVDIYGSETQLLQNKKKSQGCWDKFSGCLGSFWTTRQLTQSSDREVYVRTTLRELIIYLIFLIVLCILTFGMVSSTMFYYTNILTTAVASPEDMDSEYDDIKTVDAIYEYLQKGLLPTIYNNKDELNSFTNNILYENKMLGVPRLRQLRVRSDSCSVHKDFTTLIPNCYDDYSPTSEDRSPYGPKSGSAWMYYDDKELGSSPYWGQIGLYNGGGYYQDLFDNQIESNNTINFLKDNNWIDRGTRVVFIDFTVYNANINLFCIIKLSFEIPATGGVIPSKSLRTVKLLRYISPMDYFVLACEFIFAFFVLYYIVEEILEIKKLGCGYFTDVWNFLDILVIVISGVCIGFSIYRYIVVQNKLSDLLLKPRSYPDFTELGFWQTQFDNILALNIFFVWIKLFKYISFNKTMTQLSSTLERCAKDIFSFAIMFFIVFFAFAQLAYLILGTQVQDYNSFGNSVFSLLRIILGDFTFSSIQSGNRILGPIYFVSYVFFVFFVLLNMFLAIINDTYSEVKEEIANQKNEFEIGDYFKRGYNNILSKVGKRDKLIDIQNALMLADADNDGQLTYQEIRTNLRKLNFSDQEIEMFMARYDMDIDRTLGEEETRKLLNDLESQRIVLDKEIKSQDELGDIQLEGCAITKDDFALVERRVGRMEVSMGHIGEKIDKVLDRLGNMEKEKSKKRDAMDKILGGIVDTDKDATS